MAINYMGGAQGALGGAGTGAYFGSAIPGIGTAVGGGLGGLLGGLGGLFGGGQKDRFSQTPRFNPEGQQALSMLIQQGTNKLSNPYAGFEPIAQQARSNFQQQTVPSLAERFTSMGGGALSSPSFASQLGQAGAGLEQALAAMQSQYGMQNENQGMNMLAQGLTPSFENNYQPGSSGFGENLLSGVMRAGFNHHQASQLMNLLKMLQNQGLLKGKL